MEEKQICCCGSSTWTRVIAWVELVSFFISIIIMTILLAGISFGAGNTKTPNWLVASVTLGIILGILALLIGSLILTIVLLIGTYNRNPKYLQAWIVGTLILLLLWLIESLVACFYSGDGASLAGNICLTLLGLLVQGFCLWVVYTHKKEIEASQSPDYDQLINDVQVEGVLLPL